ncbi:MAG: hypothetical protein CBB97_09465 [Candidatus Endolissoclinum sp. TMED37]|nr:MAG: hypothetical protein CBB97_09465 [Candidatus Endolissoclinum sp. TMED37]|tara:strand:- start:1916 stop:2986 length:1071 start_codon:yes stop_codon:yes gene_type:complete
MKICIVGGTGNISTSIVSELVQQGHDVYCFNRGLSGEIPKGAFQITGDRNDKKFYEKKMQQESFDYAIDMVCMHPDQATSTIRAFEGVKHLIFCSSASVYGREYSLYPKKEDYLIKPITKYALNKASSEKIFLDAFLKKKFPVTILRPSLTYGPKLGLYRQISTDASWIDRIKKGKSLLICDDGSARCQFMHVSDAAKIFVSLLGKKQCFGEIYNVVDNKFYTWKDYHIEAMNVIGKRVHLIDVSFKNLSKFKIPNFRICEDYTSHDACYSSEKLFSVLPTFKPRVDLNSGMKEVFKYMENDGRIKNSFSQNWEDRIIRKKIKGKLENGLSVNAFLFNFDRIIMFIKKKLFKILNI